MPKLVVEIDLDHFEGDRDSVAMLLLKLAEGLSQAPYTDLREKFFGTDTYRLSARITNDETTLNSADVIGAVDVTDGPLSDTRVNHRLYSNTEEVPSERH